MKRFALFFIIGIIFLVSCSEPQGLVVVDGQQSDYSIVVMGKTDSIQMKAAETLQAYISKMTGVNLPLLHEMSEGANSIVISDGGLISESFRDSLQKAHPEAFSINTQGDNIYLSAKNSIGILYAVYTLLEEYWGVLKFTNEEEFVPETEQLILPDVQQLYSPYFDFRKPLFEGRFVDHNSFADWHKISKTDDWGLFVHTFKTLLPPSDYYEEHPEYFALINGIRVEDSQPCLSNPEVISALIANLGEKIAEQPERTYWSVSQNDYYNYCQCENCKARYDQYGSISGLYVEMANKIAEAFPEKQISTLAYQFTRSAPVNIIPRDNVNIMFCSIECNRSMPLENDPRSADFVKDLKDWSALTNNIFMWDYVVQFKNYLCPFPNFHTLQPNINLFKDYGVKMMFQQGSGGNWSDLSELKYYLISKLLWDSQLDADSISRHFITAYYGPAAGFIQEYHDLSQENMERNQEQERLDIYGYPEFYVNSFLTPDLALKYKDLMDQAEKAVADDTVFLKRVLRQRSAIDYAFVDLALSKPSEQLSFILVDSMDQKEVDPELIRMVNKLVENTEYTGNQNVNERSQKTSSYRDYALRKAELMAMDNLLDGAEIVSETPWSEVYDAGGVEALTDRKTGGSSFRSNWLGYEGEHMVLRIDLKEEKQFSSVRMNFLRDNLSWVWLPSDIFVEISNDNDSYREIAAYHAEEIENEILDIPIPIDLNFEEVKAQYLKITAKSILKCPEWHKGYGGESWIFIDELILQ